MCLYMCILAKEFWELPNAELMIIVIKVLHMIAFSKWMNGEQQEPQQAAPATAVTLTILLMVVMRMIIALCLKIGCNDFKSKSESSA